MINPHDCFPLGREVRLEKTDQKKKQLSGLVAVCPNTKKKTPGALVSLPPMLRSRP